MKIRKAIGYYLKGGAYGAKMNKKAGYTLNKYGFLGMLAEDRTQRLLKKARKKRAAARKSRGVTGSW